MCPDRGWNQRPLEYRSDGASDWPAVAGRDLDYFVPYNSSINLTWVATWQNQQNESAPSEDSVWSESSLSAWRKLSWTLIFTRRVFHTLWIIRTNASHFGYVWNICTPYFEISTGTRFSQMSNFRRVKNSHEFFKCVTNTCDFFTRVTDSFECKRQTNLSQVWKNPNVFVTPVTDSHEFFTSVILIHVMCDKLIKRKWVFVMRSYSRRLVSLSTTLCCEKNNVEETSGCS